MKLATRFVLPAFLLYCMIGVATADTTLELTVKSGAVPGVATPVSVAIDLPQELANLPADEITVSMQAVGEKQDVPGQIVNSDGGAELWWVLPGGGSQNWIATLSKGKPEKNDGFAFEDTEGQHLDLLFDGRRVTRYMYARDTSDDDRAWATYKVFHHVFDAAGEDVITQGPGRKNRYPHHRGLFLGFSRLSVEGGVKGDFWHMKTTVQEHQKFAELIAGPVLARSTALIHWVDNKGELAVSEVRRTTAYRQPAPAMLLWDFESALSAPGKPLTLGGDPEHAGMQFRAHGDIDSSQTRYQFPEGVSNLKEARDIAFAAMNMTLNRDGDSQYTVQHINHPENPKGTRHSAYRDYGRFGAFPTAEVGPSDTLTLRYRIWVAPGDFPSAEQLVGRAAALANPPKIEVAK